MRALGVSLLTVAVAASLLVSAPVAQSVGVFPPDADRRCAWPIVYATADQFAAETNYAWPDVHAAYINQVVVLGENEKVVITGSDAQARYWSITTYNALDREVIDRVNDVTVKRKGTGRQAQWTVTVSPKQDRRDPNSLQAAPLPARGQDPTLRNYTVVMYRVYLSETSGYSGGRLPTVTLHHNNPFDGVRQETLKPCKGKQVGAPTNSQEWDEAEGLPSQYFVRAAGARFYPSHDTSYLAAQVPYDPESVLMVTGKAPRVRQDVRYWSLCQNINRSPLPVVDCVADRDVTLTKGRYMIAVVTPDQVPRSERGKYEDKGVTFVEWGDLNAEGQYDDALLLVRNILPNPRFKSSIAKVPVGRPATSRMGEYAPIIEQVPLSQLAAR